MRTPVTLLLAGMLGMLAALVRGMPTDRRIELREQVRDVSCCVLA